MKNDALQHAQNVLLNTEASYAADWRNDSMKLLEQGFYAQMSEVVQPKPDQMIVDVGTGVGNQLLSLMLSEPKALTIGTERTQENVRILMKHFYDLGFQGALAVYYGSVLEANADHTQVYWKRIFRDKEEVKKKCRPLLESKILVLDDDIRYPIFLPAVLGDEKIDTGILSLPGGSTNRTTEWPFDAAGYSKGKENSRRIILASNSTRIAFAHYMAENVREGGHIVIADRLAVAKGDNPVSGFLSTWGGHLKDLKKYWKPGRMLSTELRPEKSVVELRASDKSFQSHTQQALERTGQTFSTVIGEFTRTTVPFSENPLPRPY